MGHNKCVMSEERDGCQKCNSSAVSCGFGVMTDDYFAFLDVVKTFADLAMSAMIGTHFLLSADWLVFYPRGKHPPAVVSVLMNIQICLGSRRPSPPPPPPPPNRPPVAA